MEFKGSGTVSSCVSLYVLCQRVLLTSGKAGACFELIGCISHLSTPDSSLLLLEICLFSFVAYRYTMFENPPSSLFLKVEVSRFRKCVIMSAD